MLRRTEAVVRFFTRQCQQGQGHGLALGPAFMTPVIAEQVPVGAAFQYFDTVAAGDDAGDGVAAARAGMQFQIGVRYLHRNRRGVACGDDAREAEGRAQHADGKRHWPGKTVKAFDWHRSSLHSDGQSFGENPTYAVVAHA